MYTLTEIFLFVVLILSICYAAFLERWTGAWGRRIERIGKSRKNEEIGVSVIIPFRNEEATIISSVNALLAQKESNSNVEFIFVDDNSEDCGAELVVKLTENNSRFGLIRSNGQGKKDALKAGIDQAKFDFICSLDADCLVAENWLHQIQKELHITQCDFLILPVFVHRPNSFLGDLAYTEWLSLVSVTGGSALSNDALMCNGANLVFRKKLYQLYDRPNEHSVSSGDDMFLMIEAKKVGHVAYCSSLQAAAWTNLPEGFWEFVQQRVRWAGKSKKLNDLSIILFGALLFLLQLSLLTLVVVNCLAGGNWLYLFGLLVIKLLFEYRLLAGMSRVFNIPWSFTSFVVMSLLHPFYTIFVALCSLVYKPTWKGRKIKI